MIKPEDLPGTGRIMADITGIIVWPLCCYPACEQKEPEAFKEVHFGKAVLYHYSQERAQPGPRFALLIENDAALPNRNYRVWSNWPQGASVTLRPAKENKLWWEHLHRHTSPAVLRGANSVQGYYQPNCCLCGKQLPALLRAANKKCHLGAPLRTVLRQWVFPNLALLRNHRGHLKDSYFWDQGFKFSRFGKGTGSCVYNFKEYWWFSFLHSQLIVQIFPVFPNFGEEQCYQFFRESISHSNYFQMKKETNIFLSKNMIGFGELNLCLVGLVE